ncbi:fucose isomerase [Aureimonas fodinaquatilis]|uniref:Fucose isomerase n=1 Tax=Aureimonas fodinaquatilis TaxID=2565783 RepID=A0A5B0E3T7_9HYPH|nr:fucose isomerase [Aureimonas fodinaquatilis]KAA0972069.1 fucose isomerase [Aureimonas fodinaquatilis]
MSGKEIVLFASGDLRPSANVQCWPAQSAMEEKLGEVVASMGFEIRRGHPYKAEEKHGFLASQREGMDAFAVLDPNVPVIIAESVWQYSHHVLAGLTSHKGPILTVANWSGQWPGLVGMLNLNGSLTKAGVDYATLWSETFEDDYFTERLRAWLNGQPVVHDVSHVSAYTGAGVKADIAELADRLAHDFRRNKVILGVFDEGCMGMYNAIVPDELLMPLGFFKERLSQSTLYHATTQVSDADARAVYDAMLERGMTFHLGTDPAQHLTEDQVLTQCKMYIAAVRLADTFGCEAIGIQYQQGLKDLLPASDLVEGILNNDDRPDVRNAAGKVIRQGEAIVHFNEVDECAGFDAVMTNRIHRALGQPVETTLHDLRWGDFDPTGSTDEFVWTFEISGAAPPAHHEGGWKGSDSMRQPPMFFPFGGGTLRGVAKPGEIVWSRVFIEDGVLKIDIGRGRAIALPDEETQRRWNLTNKEWPMMHGVLTGVNRDQMMAKHKANHIQVAYALSAGDADRCALAKAELARQLGLVVNLCGVDEAGLNAA